MPPFTPRSILACLLPTVIAVLSVYWFRKKRKLKEIPEKCQLQKSSINLSQIECQNLSISRSSQKECQSLAKTGTILFSEQSDNIMNEENIDVCLDSDINGDVKIFKNDPDIADDELLLVSSSPICLSPVSDCPALGEENYVQHNRDDSVESKCNGFVNKENNYNHIVDLQTEKNTSTKVQNSLNRIQKEITEQFNDNFLESTFTIIYDSNAEVVSEESVLGLQKDEINSSLDVQQQIDSQTNMAVPSPTDNQNDVFSSSIGNSDQVDTKISNSSGFVQSTSSPLSNPSDCDILSSIGTSSISLNEFASSSPLNSPYEQSSILNDSATIGDEEELSIDSGNCSIRGSLSISSANHDLESHPNIKQLTDASSSSTDGNSLLDQNSEPHQNNADSSKHSQCSDGLNCEPSAVQHVADAGSEVSVENKSSSHAVQVKNYETSNRYVYEFELPYEFCGRLIGRQGKYVKYIKELTNASACIKRHPFNDALKLVTVEGTRTDVNRALDQIRKRFPITLFPAVTLAQTNVPVDALNVPEPLQRRSLSFYYMLPSPSYIFNSWLLNFTDLLSSVSFSQLHLPENVSVDVILSSMVTAGHFFLQQPTHPTYPSLSTLDQCMMTCYTQAETPALPSHIDAGVICAANIMGGWYRAQVMYVFENGDQCEIKYVDYGGYSHVSSSSLRQIRSDFMTLPFQASECYLANVEPLNVEIGWTQEAAAVFEELAQGQILQAMVHDFHDDGTPLVQLYRVQGISSTFINRELVNRGVATWVENR